MEDADLIVGQTTDNTKKDSEKFSPLSKDKVEFIDFYKDARTFLEKANSTKFLITVLILIMTPILLLLGYLDQETHKDIVLIITLAYLGVDVYEKKTLLRK